MSGIDIFKVYHLLCDFYRHPLLKMTNMRDVDSDGDNIVANLHI